MNDSTSSFLVWSFSVRWITIGVALAASSEIRIGLRFQVGDLLGDTGATLTQH